MTGSRGWQDILLPEIKRRFDVCLASWMHTQGQTDANIHKAAGLAAAYDFIIRGVPEWIDTLARQSEEENRVAQGDPEQRPPV